MSKENKNDKTEHDNITSKVISEGKDFVSDVSGANEWKRSKLGAITGVSTFTNAFRTTFSGPLVNLGSGTAKILKRVFGKDELTKLPTDSKDAKERFEVAQQVYQRNDQEVRELIDRSNVQAMIYFIATALAFCYGIIIYPTVSTQLFFPIGHVFPFFLVFPLACLFLKNSFYNWQLRYRKLGTFREFWKSGEILLFKSSAPTTTEKKAKRKTLSSLFVMALITGLLVPLAALAQDGEVSVDSFNWMSSLGDGDIFHNLLRFIIPGVGPIGEPLEFAPSPYVVPLSNAFAAFNATLLVVGSAILGWFTLSGTVASAHEGKVLGSRWHYIWAPLRVTMGIGFLAPVSNGFCAAQILVLQLIIWGGGMGNTVWVAYVESFSSGGGGQVLSETAERSFSNTLSTGHSLNFVRSFAAKSVCYESVLRYETDNNTRTKTNAGWLGINSSWLGNSGEYVIPESSYPSSVETHTIPQEYVEMNEEEIRSKIDELNYRLEVEFQPGAAGLLGTIWSMRHLFYTTDKEKRVRSEKEHLQEILRRKLSEDTSSLEGKTIGAVDWQWDFGPLCGLIEINSDNENNLREFFNQNDTQYSKVSGDINEAHEKLVKEIDGSNVKGLIRDFAISYVNSISGGQGTVEDVDLDLFQEAKENYEKAVLTYALEINEIVKDNVEVASEEELVAEAKEKGWASSGVFYMTLARMQGALFALTEVNSSERSVDPNIIDNGGELFRYLYGTEDKHTEEINGGVLRIYDGVFSNILTTDSFSERALRAGNSEAFGSNMFLSTIERIFGRNEMREWLAVMTVSPQHPMVDMVSFGYRALNTFVGGMIMYMVATTGIGGALAGGVLTGGLGAVKGFVVGNILSQILTPIGFLIKFLLFLLLIIGVVHMYILPMIPYIMMTMFILGMLLLTLEALVAAPIWAFFHIRMDGQEFVDQVQRPGYMIAFNLVLRPSLAILGLILSYSIFGAMAWFLSLTFYPAVIAATSTTGYGVIGIITMMVVLTYLHWQIALKSFSMITNVPDRVTRWFGYGGEQLGEENEGQKSTNFIVSNFTQRAEGAVRNATLAKGVSDAKTDKKSDDQNPGEEKKKENTPNTNDGGGGDKGTPKRE